MICIQCSMKAMLEGIPYRGSDETLQEHMQRVHPDPIKTRLERKELERRLNEKLRGEGAVK